jgi:hypothetical protein
VSFQFSIINLKFCILYSRESNKFILNCFVDFDLKAFENECRKIVNDTSDRFLDLGMDEGNQSDYENMIMKQEKFSKECERFNF